MKNTKTAGFSSVFIVIIFSSIMGLMALFITISLNKAAYSLAETVTSNAASSVLTECNKSLHDEFGILALRNDPSVLSAMAEYYINESVDGFNRFIHLELDAVIVDTGFSNNYYLSDFKKQLVQLGKKNLLIRNKRQTGLNSFSGLKLPSKSISSYYSLKTDEIISFLNGKRITGDGLFISQYVMSNFTLNEIEYLVFGHETVSLNNQSCWNTIFAIRCAINLVETIEDPVLLLEALAKSVSETDSIMENETELLSYLRAMIFIISSSDRLLLRIMDVMQLVLNNGFYFKDYAYSFEISARYSRSNKTALIVQRHSWTN